MQDPPIKAAETAGDLERVGGLFLEYTRSGDFDLCFQDFPRELAGLPGEYAPPFGTTLLALTKKRDGRLRYAAPGYRPLDGVGRRPPPLVDFREIEPCRSNPVAGALFMELTL